MSTMFDILVIGGGAAGLTVAAGASQLGARVALVEREPALGGDCLHFGCVPSKTLIATANARHTMLHAEAYGLPALSIPPVDFRTVRDRILRVQSEIQEHDSVERFTKLGADVVFGAAQFIDSHTVMVGEKTLRAKRIVIATGSSAAVPPIAGLADVPYLTNRDIFALTAVPHSLVVLGGGAIAVEMAQAFARLGSKVTLIQRGHSLLSKEDSDMAAIVTGALRADGVNVITGAQITGVVRSGDSVCLPDDSSCVTQRDNNVSRHESVAESNLREMQVGSTLSDSTPPSDTLFQDKLHSIRVLLTDARGEPQTVAGDALLVALGRAPHVHGLNLEKAGVVYSARGIPVDSRMRTSVPHIYAAGDVTGAWQFTHAAGYEGSVVVANAVLRLPRKARYEWMPQCVYTSPELASIGLNERRAAEQGIAVDVQLSHFIDNDRAKAEGSTQGMMKILFRKGTKKVLGVQVVGQGAGELVSAWSVALNGGVGLSTWAGSVMPYPTRSEISKRIAGNVLGKMLFSVPVKIALRVLFGYGKR